VRQVRLAGLLAVAAIAAAALSACGGGTYRLVATFDDVGDLQKAGSVQIADVRVGQIKSIKLTKDFRARVTLSVHASARVPRDSEAVVRTTSLLGEKFVELRPLGSADQGPFLRDGDTVTRTEAAPELEFVAGQAIDVLGAVSSNDVATLVETGAVGFGQRAPELRALIADLSTFSATLASRTGQITGIIDNLDRATKTLAGGADDVRTLLGNLATSTQVLVDNREKALAALAQLSRLARVQNEVLDRYQSDMDRQIKQLDAILGVAAGQTTEVGRLVDFLDKFVYALPKAIPGDFTQVYMWAVPYCQDARASHEGCPP